MQVSDHDLREYCVQMVHPLDLLQALDSFVDGSGESDVLVRKMGECSDSFIENILSNGFAQPICVQVSGGWARGWMQGNGHHRLAVALAAMMDEIPVVFSTEGYMLDSVTCDRNGRDCWDDWD